MSRTCDQAKNAANCSCTYPGCSRKGLCCQCVANHRAVGEIPGCFFPAELERTYDRSIRALVNHYR